MERELLLIFVRVRSIICLQGALFNVIHNVPEYLWSRVFMCCKKRRQNLETWCIIDAVDSQGDLDGFRKVLTCRTARPPTIIKGRDIKDLGAEMVALRLEMKIALGVRIIWISERVIITDI